MMQVTNSPLLQALGYAIVNSVWQFALLWLLYMGVNSFFIFTAHKRYVTAITLQFAGFTWFIGTLLFYYGETARNAFSVSAGEFPYFSEPVSSISFKQLVLSTMLKAEFLLPYLSIAYLILVSWFAVKMIYAFKHTQHIKTNGLKKINVEWRLFVKQLSEQLGIKQNVRIFLSTLVESPVTIGYLKPVILMPVAVINNLSVQQIEAILIHELAHIKRYDYVFNILLSVIEVSLFFNPFMQLLSKQMKRERENSCDDWVLQYKYSACTYAKALLQIASFKTNVSAKFAVSAVDNKRALLIRVKRMIEKKDFYRNYRQQIASLVFITLLISSVAWFTPAKYPAFSQTDKGTQPAKSLQSIMANVENPLFNPVFFLSKNENKQTENNIKQIEVAIEASANATATASVKTVKQDVETAIAEQFSKQNVAEIIPPNVRDVQSVNLVLDSALFQNFATRELVLGEIQKLKKDFELFNKSSLFENINWKQFWDNTKVQKQLETAFKQLKELEMHQRKSIVAVNAVNRSAENNQVALTAEQARLQMVASRKLASIVKERIIDIKAKGEKKPGESFELTFDLNDLPRLSGPNQTFEWSFAYDEKPQTKQRIIVAPKTKNSCAEPVVPVEIVNEMRAADRQVTETRKQTAPRVRIVRI